MSRSVENNLFEWSSNIKYHFIASLDNIYTKYHNYIDMYSYLYMGLFPIYMYENPYFIINNISNMFITLCCMAHILNQKYDHLFLLAPVVFLIDRINHFTHDTTIYMIVFIVLFLIVQITYLVSYTTRSLLNDPDFISECKLIDNMMNNNIINEPVETENTESADETENTESADETEQSNSADENEQSNSADENEQSDPVDETENAEPVDETDMSDLPELI